MIKISNIEKNNYVNGNGCRYVIWVQGCTLGCKDCWNKYTWDKRGGDSVNIESIYDEIISLDNIDGVTYTGGEPLLQANELLELSKMIRENTKLGIHIFTGFEQDEVLSPEQSKLIELADTIVFGRFDKSKENNNQTVRNNSKNHWHYNNSDVQIEINDDMDLVVTGYPTDELIKTLKGI